MKKKVIKITAISLASIILAAILVVVIYVIYVAAQYYRIKDNTPLTVTANQSAKVQKDTEYSIVSYNLGFGAYSPEFSFFMDTGMMNDGKKIKGKYARGLSKKDVLKNVNGQIATSKGFDADFYFLQEVDTDGDRSYHINMLDSITQSMPDYGWTYAQNFHTANLIYPLNDPIGKSFSGIVTLSKYGITSAVRRSFPVSKAFPDRFFDLDRCFSVHYLDIEGESEKKLVLINLHMSAYDKGGTIRAKQLTMLNEVLRAERNNYVIVGGDFNHCLIADHKEFTTEEQALQYFESQQRIPEWVKNSVLRNSEVESGYEIIAAKNAATCRGAEMPYTKGVNYSTVIDGFIVSTSNVQVVSEETVDYDYEFSDHNPVKLVFKLL